MNDIKQMYSRAYKYRYGANLFRFRYNFDLAMLECIVRPTAEMVEDIKETAENSKLDWRREEARMNLKSNELTGYIVLDSEPLSEDEWYASKLEYMDKMSEELMSVLAIG